MGKLHDFCRARLAAHKTPTLWFAVDAFPLTTSGKLPKLVLHDQIKRGALGPARHKRASRWCELLSH